MVLGDGTTVQSPPETQPFPWPRCQEPRSRQSHVQLLRVPMIIHRHVGASHEDLRLLELGDHVDASIGHRGHRGVPEDALPFTSARSGTTRPIWALAETVSFVSADEASGVAIDCHGTVHQHHIGRLRQRGGCACRA